MRKLLLSLMFMSAVGTAFGASEASPARIPAFTENRGQVFDSEGKPRPDVLFTAENNGVQIYFRNDAVSYVFAKTRKDGDGDQTVIDGWHRSDLRFVGANPNPRVSGEKALTHTLNYYRPGSAGATGVRSYEKITYHNIYPHIDLVFFTKENNFKYEFVVRPGGNPDLIRMRYEGVSSLSVARDGSVEAKNPLGSFGEDAPLSFQAGKPVASSFRLENGEVSFLLGDYDKNADLVIDPLTRQFSFNRGGTSFDRAMATDIDANGNTLLAGWTASSAFPVTPGAVQNTFRGDNDVFAMQVSPSGAILWATYFGGTGRDQALALAVGNNNAVYVAGSTTSTNLPTTAGAFQTTAGGTGDGFVMQLTAGGALGWSSYYGGPSNDQINGIDVFSNGDIALVGRTFSISGISSANALAGSRDAFLVRMNMMGSARVWGRYLGGASDDQAWTVAVDAADNIYVAGQTSSAGLATPGVMQTALRSQTDGFLARFNSAGTPGWFSYYGGNDLDFITAIDIDDNGNVFGTGITSSVQNFPLSNNIFQPAFGGLQDAFLFGANPNGGLVMSTYVGGASTEQGYGIGIVGNNVYVTGSSNSANFATVNPNAVNLPFQASNAGSFDFFLLKVNTTNFTRQWSILNGGQGDDVSRALAVTSQGRISVVGYTNSNNFNNFPAAIAGQPAAGTGNDDLFTFVLTDDATNCPTVNTNATVVNAICQTLPTGGIVVTEPLGTNFVYSLSGQSTRPVQASPEFFDLPSGNYTLRVRNNTNSCEYTRAITLNADVPFTVNTSRTNPSCGLGGSITVNAPAGPDFSYSLTGPVNVGFGANPVFSNLISGSYRVTVRDGIGCEITTAEIVLSDGGNTLPLPAGTTVLPTCATATDGRLTVSAPVGENVTYTLSGTVGRPAQASPVFNNLPVGTYSVTARVGSCVSAPANFTLGAGTGIAVNTSVTGTTCAVSTDGVITVSAQGFGLTYSLEGTASRPAQGSNRFDNLAGGSYTVTVRDGQGCTGTSNVTVGISPQSVPVVLSTTPATCVSNNNGSVSVISPVNSGNRYSIRGGTVNVENSTSPVFNNLPSGSYTVTVLLANGCTAASNPTVVSNPAQLNASATGGVIACGSTNGTINVNASGGSGTLQYELSGPVNRGPQTSNVFSGLPTGNYNVVVRDANGCATTASASIALPGTVSVTTAATATVCGQNNGTVTATVLGTTGTVLYSIIAGPVSRDPQVSATFTNLPAGEYTVRAVDANNCAATAPVTVTAGPNSLILTPNLEPIACNGGTANLTVGVQGNTGDMVYTLSGRAPQNGNNRFTNITPGTYTLTVVDSRNCTASQTLNVTQPAVLTASATVTQISCPNQQLGTVIVSSTGGTGVKMYTLTGPVTIGPQMSATFNNLNPGTYRASVMDANGCMVEVASSLVINTINRVVIGSLVPMMPRCNGGRDGSLTANLAPATGVAPFAYRINNGAFSTPTNATSFTFNLLAAGSYTVDVRDANGCISSMMATLGEPSAISAVVSGTVPTSCVVGDGNLNVTAAGGTPPYQYSLDGANFQTPSRFDFVQAGYYTVTVRDANGCTGTANFTLNHAGSPRILNVSVTGTECFTNSGSSTGQIVIAATGAPNLFYSIDDGISFRASNTGSFTFSNLGAGEYRIRVSDVNGCTAFWQPVTIEAPAPFIIQNVVVTNPVCSNSNPTGGIIEIQTTGGRLPLRFSVDGGVTFTLSNRITDLYPRAGGYQIVVRDANNCEALGSTTRNIFNASGLSLNTPMVMQPTCGMMNGSITVTPTGGSPGTKSFFLNGNLIATSSNSSFMYRNLGEGDYTVRIVDAAGCRVESRVSLRTLNLRVTPMPGACNSQTGQIMAEVDGGSGDYDFTIEGTQVQVPAFAIVPLAPFTPAFVAGRTSFTFGSLYPGIYEITITDRNSGACTREQIVTLGTNTGPTITNITKVDRVCSGATQVNSFVQGSISVASSGAAVIHLFGPVVQAQAVVNNAIATFTAANGLPAGTYYVFADNGSGCFTPASEPVVITEPAPIVVTAVNVTQPRCGGSPTGSLMITATGGRTLEYSTDGGTSFQASATFSNLNAGTAFAAGTIIVREQGTGLQCWASWPLAVNIQNEGNFAITNLAVTGQTCSGLPDGTFTVTTTGGRQPFTFVLTPSVGPAITVTNINAPAHTFTGLVSGSYTAQVTDANGCVATSSSRQVTGNTSVLTLRENAPSNGCTTVGSIEWTVTNPVSPASYEVSFDGGVTFLAPVAAATGFINNLPAGTYTVVVRNPATNCRLSAPIVITDANAAAGQFSVNFIEPTNPTCAGNADGSVRVSVRFGTGGGTMQLTGAVRTFAGANPTSTWTGLSAGSYTLTITDATCGTPYTQTITLTTPTAVVAIADVTPASCNNGTPDGTVIVRASGGTGLYEYTLRGGDLSIVQRSNIFTGLTPGVYDVEVRDLGGNNTCIPTAISATVVTAESGFYIDNSSNANRFVQASCQNVTDAYAQISIVNLPPNARYVLNGVTVTPSQIIPAGGIPPITTVFFRNLIPSTYTLRVLTPSGCFDEIRFTIAPTLPIRLTSVSIVRQPSCGGSNDGDLNFTVTGGQDQTRHADPNNAIANNIGREFILSSYFGDIPQIEGIVGTGNPGGFAVNGLSNGLYVVKVFNEPNRTAACSDSSFITLNTVGSPAVRACNLTNAFPPACLGSAQIRNSSCSATVPGTLYQRRQIGQANWVSNVPATSPNFTNLAPGMYAFRVRFGTNCFSYTVPVTITGCVAPKEITFDENEITGNISLYPNPTQGTVNLKMFTGSSENVEVKLVDLTGREVLSRTVTTVEGMNEIPFELNGLTDGVYVMSVNRGGVMTTLKVVKN